MAVVADPQQTKFVLDESRIPRSWYNIAADLPVPQAPPLHPGTHQPIGPDDLAPLFPMALIGQEVSGEREIEIPEPVRDAYRLYQPSPLYRAHRLEAVSAVQRAGPVQRVGLADGLRDLDLAILADDLLDELHREQRREVPRPDGLARARMQHRRRRRRQVGRDVVPGARDPILVEDELRPVGAHGCLPCPVVRRQGAVASTRRAGPRD